MKRPVFLIGGRASGKTTVGRLAARRLGADWVDTDELFVSRQGMSIADFVAENGWDAFRDKEAEALAEAARPPARVVACGGGIVLRPGNREVLSQGLTVYLRADAAVLAARLSREPNAAQRPSLTGDGVAEEIARVLAEREQIYQQCADLTLDATLPPNTLADQITQAAKT